MPRSPSVARTLAVLPLDDASADLATVGGKGASLATLARAGLPVPPGFHVSTAAYRLFVERYTLGPQIVEAAAGDADEAAGRIAALFSAHEMPEEIAGPIRDAYAALGGPVVAVRSSATAEDLPGASFAGQQDTYLGLTGADAVVDAVRRCWASLWTARAIAYRRREGIDPAQVTLAVVVQQLVDADASGVLFTADPVSGATDRMTVDATWGLGESLVGGGVTPDELVLDAATGAVHERRTEDKAVMTVRDGAGTVERPVPEPRRRAPVLDDAAAAELASLGRRIADLSGRPMDVEWARAGGQLAILQARPITGVRDPWNDSLAGDFLWTATNAGEAVPDVMTPCTWSLVQIFLSHAMASGALPGLRGYGRVGGRLYLNLSNAATMSAALGIGASRYRALIRSSLGAIPDEVDIPPAPLGRLRILRMVIPTAIGVLRRARANAPRFPGFIASNPGRCAALRTRIGSITDGPELARLWARELFPLLAEASDMLESATRRDPVALITVEERLRALVGESDATALTSGLRVDGDVLASLGPVVGLAQLERGEIDAATWALRYGHRGPHEFEVSEPSPAERSDRLDAEVAAVRVAGTDPQVLLEKQEAANRAAWDRLVAAHPRRVRATRKRLARWARAERAREQARSEVIRVFGVLRAYALRAGELTGLGPEVFMLDIDEITATLRGRRAPETAERRSVYEGYRALPVYPTLIRGRFDPFSWAADPHRRTDLYDATASGPAATGGSDGVVRGFPGAAGVVEGTARVLAGPDEAAALQPGEILVTTVTNIGWTPLFPRAAAVVTDVGAPLSHAAIVARELGIPAVVGCGDATARLHTGDRLRVDGSDGSVRVLASG